MENRELTAALHRLLDRLDALGEGQATASEAADWGDGVLARLAAMSVVVPTGPSEGATCPGCDEACWVVPEARGAPGRPPVFVHPCHRRDDVGLVRFRADELRSWRLNPAALASALAASSGAVADELVPGLWKVGALRTGRNRRLLLFAVAFARWSAAERRERLARFGGTRPIVLVPCERPAADEGVLVVPLAEVIDVGPEGLLLDLEAIAGADEPGAAVGTAVDLPPGTTWEEVTIRVVDDEHVQIVAKGRIEPRSFAELGMANRRRRDPAPNEAWGFLLVLARAGGTMTWKDDAASEDLRTKMKLLRKQLCASVGIADDPFHRYEPRRGWRPLFALVDLRRLS